MSWSEKYLGIPYKWESRDLSQGSDCLRLIEIVLQKEKNYKIDEDGPIDENWFEKEPSRLIEKAIQRGSIIEDIPQLREFDVVFFKMEKCVDHMGIMIDNYGKFLHQLIRRPSRIDRITERHWLDKWFCGVRVDFGK
jgi:cell wall-associated NlpC family hydrolase